MRTFSLYLLLATLSVSGLTYADKKDRDDPQLVIEIDLTDIVKEKIEKQKKDKLVPKQPSQPAEPKKLNSNEKKSNDKSE